MNYLRFKLLRLYYKAYMNDDQHVMWLSNLEASCLPVESD